MSSVRLLDLAPKRKIPLSLQAPLDYLLLLYWCLFFPQALRWYIEKFGTVEYPKEKRNWHSFRQLLREDVVQRNLFRQGLILTLLLAFGSAGLLQFSGMSINWLGVFLGLTVGLSLGVVFSSIFGVASGAASGLAFGIGFALSGASLEGGIGFGIAIGLAVGVGVGLVGGVGLGLARGLGLGLAASLVAGVAFGVMLSVEYSMGYIHMVDSISGSSVLGEFIAGVAGVIMGIYTGLMISVILGLSFGTMILRLPDFVVVALFAKYMNQDVMKPYKLFSRTTSFPLPNLQAWIVAGLRHDTPNMIENINQILAYSLQFIPAIRAVNQWLLESPAKKIFQRANQLTITGLYDWNLLRFASAQLSGAMRQRIEIIEGLPFIPAKIRQNVQKNWDSSLRFDTPARAVCAGYWLLHEKDTSAALEAFSHTRDIAHGETLYQTVRVLDLARKVTSLQDIFNLETETEWLSQLKEEPLRPQTIDVLRRLRNVVQLVGGVAVSSSYSKLNSVAAIPIAIALLTEQLDTLNETCPELERPFVREIIEKWRDILAREVR